MRIHKRTDQSQCLLADEMLLHQPKVPLYFDVSVLPHTGNIAVKYKTLTFFHLSRAEARDLCEALIEHV